MAQVRAFSSRRPDFTKRHSDTSSAFNRAEIRLGVVNRHSPLRNRRLAPVQLQFLISPMKMHLLDLRFGKRGLAVEFLEFLDVHPPVPGADRAEQGKNLDVSKNCCLLAEHESAPEMVYE